MSVNNESSIYGFSLLKSEQKELRDLCQKKFGMTSASYMRIVVRAILDDRITIEKPKDIKEIYK